MGKIILTVNGSKIEAQEGETILNAALNAGIYIPHLCYHPDLKPLGNCNMCMVKNVGDDNVVRSCETLAEEGMVINTKDSEAEKIRNLSLELMLASHPKDCTSCDKYLNCELQSLMQYTGIVHSRLREIDKENYRIAKSDVFIKKEMNRCIQCGRCIRVCEDVRGVGVLAFNKKNGETYVNVKNDVTLLESDCRLCGACVEVCPTGAIQDVKGLFSPDQPKQMSLVPCKNDCPAHTDVPLYIRLTKEGKYSDAVCVFREKLTFPHSLGYICSHPCEAGCKRNHLSEPISIREMKKFAVENDSEFKWKERLTIGEKKDKKVGIIGAGPAGMTAAFLLAKKGYEVDVFEKEAKAGGMLTYGIPKYRLPQDVVDNEVNILNEFGINLIPNTKISSLDEMKAYDAVLVSIGTTKGNRPAGFTKSWDNAIDGVDFCKGVNSGEITTVPDNIFVYGGGNVAFDCARGAKKLGAKNVYLACMESREDMLADDEEISEGLKEGVGILNGRIIASLSEDGNTIKTLHTKGISSFKFTANGLEVEEIEGSERDINVDQVIFAIGQKPDINENFGIDLVRGAYGKVDDKQQSSVDNVFGAGDFIYGTKLVVNAIASGRSSAKNIDLFLGGDGQIEDFLYDRVKQNGNIGVIENFSSLARKSKITDYHAASYEGSRCLQCDLRLELETVKHWVDPHYKSVKEVK